MSRGLLGSLRRWAGRGALSVLDQGFHSGAHFLLVVLLARLLSPADFGAFGVAYAFFALAEGIHAAVLLEPMSVYGASRDRTELDDFVGRNVVLHGWVSASIGALLGVTGLVLLATGQGLGAPLAYAGLASPVILLQRLYRRAMYLCERTTRAAVSSAVYALGTIAGLWFTAEFGLLTGSSAFLILAGSALMASVPLWGTLGARFWRSSTGRIRLGALWKEYWPYGRWSSGAVGVTWVNSSAYVPLLGAIAGLHEVAAFRAIQNLIQPMTQTLTALGVLLLPRLARSQRGGQNRGGPRFQLLGLFFVVAASYGLLLILTGDAIVSLLYGDEYGRGVILIPAFVAFGMLWAPQEALVLELKASGRPSLIFRGQLLGAGLTLTIGTLLVLWLEALGAVFGLFLGVIGNIYVFRRYARMRADLRSD